MDQYFWREYKAMQEQNNGNPGDKDRIVEQPNPHSETTQ